jgi:hypothetical protein
MIFYCHCEAFVCGIERRPLRHGPRFEDAFHLESKIIVQVRSTVLLYNETELTFLLHLWWGFRSAIEVALAAIFLQGHEG